jgi:recombination protein RecA
LKNSNKEVIGIHCRATVKKNRLGPPFRQAEFEVYFDSGIADYASWIELAKKKGIMTGPSNGLVYNGEKYNTESLVKMLNTNATFKDELYKKICDAVIMQYKSPNSAVLENLVVEPENAESPDVIESE